LVGARLRVRFCRSGRAHADAMPSQVKRRLREPLKLKRCASFAGCGAGRFRLPTGMATAPPAGRPA
jgi:hypothetical protein